MYSMSIVSNDDVLTNNWIISPILEKYYDPKPIGVYNVRELEERKRIANGNQN